MEREAKRTWGMEKVRRAMLIDTAARAAVAMYPDFFVYKGGSHVAVHRRPEDGRGHERLIFAPDCAVRIRWMDVAGVFADWRELEPLKWADAA